MRLVVPSEVRAQLREALMQVGRTEIGGILMGESLGSGTFRIKEITVQKHGGTFATFVRILKDCLTPLQNFFRSTKNEFRKFNYMGEWHSHHSFELMPSMEDHRSMFEIIEDERVGANFVVLFLVKLDSAEEVDGAVFVYVRGKRPYYGEVVWECALTV